MDSDRLISLAQDIDAGCRLTGEFTVRSGQVVSEYFDKYLFESRPELLRLVTDAAAPAGWRKVLTSAIVRSC